MQLRCSNRSLLAAPVSLRLKIHQGSDEHVHESNGCLSWQEAASTVTQAFGARMLPWQDQLKAKQQHFLDPKRGLWGLLRGIPGDFGSGFLDLATCVCKED